MKNKGHSRFLRSGSKDEEPTGGVEKMDNKHHSLSRALGKNVNSRVIVVLFADILAMFVAWYGTLWLRYDFMTSKIPNASIGMLNRYFIFIVLTTVLIYTVMKLYESVWSYFSVHELMQVVYTYLLMIPVYGIFYLIGLRLPLSVLFVSYILNFLFCGGIRVSYRAARLLTNRYGSSGKTRRSVPTMVIGAGAAGKMVLRELIHSKDSVNDVKCLIDDNPLKSGRFLDGVPIVGGRDKILSAVDQFQIKEIIFAIPTASSADKKAILALCQQTKCEIKKVPGLYQLVNCEVTLDQLRPVEMEDLLGRNPIKVNIPEIREIIRDKVCLVTGGGGSIGSELCRQIASYHPKRLIVVDIYENNAYALQQELIRQYGDALPLTVLIASVRNRKRIDEIFNTYRPDMVFHAAAHKHVPLMEDSPTEAIKNNVFGTYNVAESAAAHGVRAMLLISTDKAVNPTNIMGASKRLCEMVIQMMGRRHLETCYCAVRFGNVLGSNGSVIPLFKQQIAEGGPVTVTDKRIIRYFMTIPEAVSLVLQSCYYCSCGEICVLDMGEPVRIDDMARNLIRLSGYEPDVDIPIVYTGLRPGEKLYEELLMEEEGLRETENKLIRIAQPIEMDDQTFAVDLERLKAACAAESPAIKDLVAEIVPTYKRQ